ncbi:unnamed protein product, partial [Closterium sp. Naga37s-1]
HSTGHWLQQLRDHQWLQQVQDDSEQSTSSLKEAVAAATQGSPLSNPSFPALSSTLLYSLSAPQGQDLLSSTRRCQRWLAGEPAAVVAAVVAPSMATTVVAAAAMEG